MISLGQIRAARAFLHIDQPTLARLAEVSVPTIQRLENPQFGPERSSVRVITAVKTALEKSGIEFLPPSDEAGEGVRLRVRR
ncbi:MAG: putative transcriptional regulator [Limimaricola cinnabarinus]|jgi:predicted transcriptional regulator|uniref:transcriptional regulator n=1 Tax=Limimaricola cinnabarinus TaxID=1125964 RepID=UPI0039E600A8